MARKKTIPPDGEGVVPATTEALRFADRLLASYHARDVARALLAASLIYHEAAEAAYAGDQ